MPELMTESEIDNRAAAIAYRGHLNHVLTHAPVTEKVWEAYEAARKRLADSTAAVVDAAQPGRKVWTVDGGGMTVSEVTAEGKVVLTADGGGYVPEWHTGPEAETVMVERYSISPVSGKWCREFHGYVDAVSRRIVQTG